MREIKFRAKETDSGKWVYGYYWQTDDTTFCFKEDYDRNPNNTKHYILFDSMTDWSLPNIKMRADIIPETLGQFTGLYDKNKVPIYESDVVEVTKEGILERGVVSFSSGCYFIKVKEHFLNSVTLLPLYECARNDYELKVIGNIYENPELLGE